MRLSLSIDAKKKTLTNIDWQMVGCQSKQYNAYLLVRKSCLVNLTHL